MAEFIGFNNMDVELLCRKYGLSYDECRFRYGGYRQHGYEIFNPGVILKTIYENHYCNYQEMSPFFEMILDYIHTNFDGAKYDVVRMLSNENVDIHLPHFLRSITSFRTRDDLFAYLIYIGYLAYDMERKTCCIPNGEARKEWFNALQKANPIL